MQLYRLLEFLCGERESIVARTSPLSTKWGKLILTAPNIDTLQLVQLASNVSFRWLLKCVPKSTKETFQLDVIVNASTPPTSYNLRQVLHLSHLASFGGRLHKVWTKLCARSSTFIHCSIQWNGGRVVPCLSFLISLSIRKQDYWLAACILPEWVQIMGRVVF